MTDQPVVDAMGADYERLKTLARLAKEQPATRRYVESQMAKILDAMPAAQRLTLREALRKATRKGR